MTINTKVTIGGTTYDDYTSMKVTKSLNDFNSSSTFRIIFDSPFGRHSTDFSIGQEVQILVDEDTDPPTTILFTGILERIQFKGKENTQTVELSGRDYSLRMQDTTVEPVVFTNTEISSIVTTIMDELKDITTTNVNTTQVTLKRIAFNHLSIFEAIAELAELAGFVFYVDESKDLHFEEKESASSGIIINNTNINMSTFNQTREGMANEVFVYGDRYLAGYTETLKAGSPVGGSVFTLINKPFNTLVEILGSTQKGGVFGVTIQPESGINYLVSFHDKQLIFTSGTDLGDSIPASGGSIIVTYDREIPIVKRGRNKSSIDLYGLKRKIIDDQTIKDPNTAEDILKKTLENSDPFRGVEANIEGWHSLTPGNTVDVVLDDFNLNETVPILNVAYKFDKNSIQSGKVIKIRLDKKIIDITDELTTMRKRLEKIEGKERQSTDLITRLETAKENLPIVGSRWLVMTSTATGSVSLLYDTGFTPKINPMNLASGTDQGNIAGSFTGSASAFGPFQIAKSGGFYT